jgi:hypothetical protein
VLCPTPILDEESHIYHVGERIIPGTTTVLREYVRIELYGEEYFVAINSGDAIRGDFMDRARKFGNAIHKAAFYILTGAGLEISSLHPRLVPTLMQFDGWREKYKPQAEMCEVALYSKRYHYCGTIDFFGRLAGYRTGKDLVDFKTTEHHQAVEQQTSAYENLVRENTGYKGVIRRWVLELPKDGSEYRFIRLVKRDAFRYFLNELSNYNWRIANG